MAKNALLIVAIALMSLSAVLVGGFVNHLTQSSTVAVLAFGAIFCFEMGIVAIALSTER